MTIPKFTHTFSTLISIYHQKDGENLYANTISWGPADFFEVSRNPHPGRNKSLRESAEKSRDIGGLHVFGPYRVKAEFATLFFALWNRIDDGEFMYSASFNADRLDWAPNCFQMHDLLDTELAPCEFGFKRGISVTRLLAEKYRPYYEFDESKDTVTTYPALIRRLGLPPGIRLTYESLPTK